MMPDLTDDQISDILDDVADDSVHAQVAADPAHAAKVGAARQVEEALHDRLFRWDCPSPQALGDYHLGLATRPDAALIEQHLANCVLCQRDLQTLRGFLAQEDEDAVSNTTRHALPPAAHARPGEVFLQQVPMEQLAALRGDAPRTSIVASCEGATVFLELEHADDGLLLTGQVVAEQPAEQSLWEGALVEIRHQDDLVATAVVDNLGEFHISFDKLSPMTARLYISAEEGPTLVLDEVVLS